MGLWGGIKKIGRGIKKGVKKGVKAVDKFDDWIKLKELAQIGQFIPGVNVFAKPLAMTYSGFDVAKGIKNKDLMGAALAGASMYGSHKIKPTGFGGGVKELGLGQTGAEALGSGINPAATVGFKSQAMQNLKDFGGGASNPFGLMDKYEGLDKGSKFAIGTLAPPILGSLQGGQEQSRGPSAAPYQSYQPIDYGNIAGFSPTTQLPTQAQGGITGDDWHQPINRLPANYEGWVTQPSLATLGEAGKEAVLPLNKLLPAMNKGGLNYSPGQAIVGEAGPEYVTRLGPGEEQYAQSILREQPVPQMQRGGVAGGVTRGLKHAVFPRTLPGANQGWLNSRLLKLLPRGAKLIPGLGAAFEAWQLASDASDLYQGRKGGKGWTQEGTEEYGLGDFLEDQMVNLGYASGVGLPLSVAYDWKRGQLNDLKDLLVEFGWMDPYRKYDVSPGIYAMLKAKADAQPGPQTSVQPGPQTSVQPGTQTPVQPGTQTPVQPVPQTSVQTGDPLGLLRQMTLEEGTGDIDPRFLDEEAPSFLGERTSPQERIDLSLLDNENARYWMHGEGSRYAPGRLHKMIKDLGYSDTPEQVEEIRRNAKNKDIDKWYRAVHRPGVIPLQG